MINVLQATVYPESYVIARSGATKQSMPERAQSYDLLDCFASLAMTELTILRQRRPL